MNFKKSCVLAKSHQLPFTDFRDVYSHPFELIFINI